MAVEEISVRELHAVVAIGTPVFDVREPDEFQAGHVPGAVPIPLGDVMARLSEFPQNESFAVICRSGARSMRAAQYLDQQGRTCVNVAGGTMAWIEAGFEVATGTDQT
jgi:rhodanese-related sulfurtransferase